MPLSNMSNMLQLNRADSTPLAHSELDHFVLSLSVSLSVGVATPFNHMHPICELTNYLEFCSLTFALAINIWYVCTPTPFADPTVDKGADSSTAAAVWP